ncbi:MAG: hypothetical protein PHT75_02895 [Bacilli bacterium]|nr:hypothetical protein [Bacilli bacterium]MDD3305054.1 hypothetical protein [Bacilli bacterium]MDD4053479.1 hypothetical protein [Bacilli bacterium]MDD4411514.1 hypothetical protein [Bacilli bacterium]
MTKKTFLKKIESNLSSLGEEKVAEIVKKYEKIIDEEIALGKVEKDVVAALGSIEMITRLYINEDDRQNPKKKVNKTKTKSCLSMLTDKTFNAILNYMDKLFDMLDKDGALRILTIICYVVIAFVGLHILYVPFLIIDAIGNSTYFIIFNDLFFYKVVTTFWSFSINMCYIILSIWFIIQYINKVVAHYTSKFKIKTKPSDKEDNIKKEAKTQDKEDVQVTTENNSAFDIIFIILKVFVIIVTIPIIMLEVSLFILLFFFVTLLFKGVIMFGPIIIVIGLIILIAALLDLVYLSISKGGIK